MNKKFLLIFFFALVLRLSLVFVAHHGDLNNNISWGNEVLERGLVGFYGSSDANDWPYSAPNQPPLYILLFAATSWLYKGIETISWDLNNSLAIFPSRFIWFWEIKGMDLLVKLPSIFADLGIALLIYKYFTKQKKEKLALVIPAVWLFNPVSWYNSAIWGQTDAIVNLLGLIGILHLLNKRLTLFSIFFTTSLLFKGSLLIFTPILAFVLIKHKYTLKHWLRAVFASIFIVFLASVWFHPQIDLPVWLFDLYTTRILPGEIGYLTANAFNLWWLVDAGKTLDSTIYLGMPARIWGIIIALTATVGTIYWLSRKKLTDARVLMSLAFIALLIFLFMTRMHERYLFPFFPIATILLGSVNWLILPYIILSITHLLNLYHLFWAPSLAPLESVYLYFWFSKVLSFLNIGVFIFILIKLAKVNISK